MDSIAQRDGKANGEGWDSAGGPLGALAEARDWAAPPLGLGPIHARREEFVAAAAHELRAPLASIQLGLGLLSAEAANLSPDARGVLDAVRRNAQRLAIHVGDLIAADQLGADILRLQIEPLDLRDVARDAVAAVQPFFREKGQRVEFSLPRPLRVRADARRMEQVLVNVLINAHRYTPANSCVTLTGRAAARSIRLTMSDTGPGVPADQLEHIFERHQRLQPGHGGSGLGLSIARRLLDLHGGRIWAEHAPGRGAIFQIALPRERVMGASREEADEQGNAHPDRR